MTSPNSGSHNFQDGSTFKACEKLEEDTSPQPSSLSNPPQRIKLAVLSLSQPSDIKIHDLPADPKTSKMTYEEFKLFITARSNELYLLYEPSLEMPLDVWLKFARPSCISVEEHGIGWVAVRSPSAVTLSHIPGLAELEGESEDDSDEDDSNEDDDSENEKAELLKAWDKFLASNVPLTQKVIQELASAHNVTTGKWIIHAKPGAHIDLMWRRIAINIVQKSLGDTAVGAIANTISFLDDKDHVILVWHDKCTSNEKAFLLENALRQAGVRSRMQYKPDLFTRLGLLPKNPWNFRPCTFISYYNAITHESKIESVYE